MAQCIKIYEIIWRTLNNIPLLYVDVTEAKREKTLACIEWQVVEGIVLHFTDTAVIVRVIVTEKHRTHDKRSMGKTRCKKRNNRAMVTGNATKCCEILCHQTGARLMSTVQYYYRVVSPTYSYKSHHSGPWDILLSWIIHFTAGFEAKLSSFVMGILTLDNWHTHDQFTSPTEG